MIHSNLSVCRLTHRQHMRTCGYWFTVQSGATAHTAFATLAGLYKWAMLRGLTIPQDLPKEGRHEDAGDERHAYCQIVGAYRTQSHMDEDEFRAITAVFYTRTLSNGDWTEARITIDPDGLRTVHYLNPNIHSREVFDYTESKALFN